MLLVLLCLLLAGFLLRLHLLHLQPRDQAVSSAAVDQLASAERPAADQLPSVEIWATLGLSLSLALLSSLALAGQAKTPRRGPQIWIFSQ